MIVSPSPPASDVLLEAKGIAFRYPRCAECTVEGVDLTLRRGERIALIGASGTGKTTLLRALEGSLRPEAGEVRRYGTLALVYQDQRLVAEGSVLANVCSGALAELGPWRGLVGFPSDIEARARELLDDLGLTDLADRRVGSLSGGQRQRVAIARALCSRPQVLLADEPFANLDGRNARRVLDLLSELQDKYGFALLVSLHDLSVARRFDRVVMMRNRCLMNCELAGMGLTPTEVEDFGSEPPEPDFSDERPRSRRYRLARATVLTVVTCALLGWSAQAINFRASSFAGAWDGLRGFFANLLPSGAGGIAALPWGPLFGSLVQTVQMAILGTALGIVLSLPLAVFASRQTAPRWVRYPMRFLLNLVRTIPSILWALLFVAFVGLGPVAGVFALAIYSLGYLTKFLYEGLENVDDRPASALSALGASRGQIFFRAILPAARPALVGACLFVFEYNIRAASVLGVVGAGGIGQDLMYYIEWRRFPEVAAAISLLLVLVVALDTVSQAWRKRLARQRGV